MSTHRADSRRVVSLVVAVALLSFCSTSRAQVRMANRAFTSALAVENGTTENDTTSIIQTLEERGRYTRLVAALKRSGLAQALVGNGPFTLFAPTDEAFAERAGLIREMGREELAALLRHHIVPKKVSAKQLDRMATLRMGDGTQLPVEDDGKTIDRAAIIEPGVQARNGVIHGIDTVLIPEGIGVSMK